MLIRYVLYKQFRTICDFTFATSHKEYFLSCCTILFSNCTKLLYFLHNNSQSEICVKGNTLLQFVEEYVHYSRLAWNFDLIYLQLPIQSTLII